MRSRKEVDCHPRRGQRESHIINMLSPSTRQQSDITRFFTVRKHLPTLNTLNSALVGDLSFPASVETEIALWSVSLLLELGLCRQKSYFEETEIL